ncbi:hypothetical protein [Ralstonia flatus]|uniref:hypothetical protein n=1 Tax=Ralstonia flatus TaxID=3058601 RepID=UPI0019D1721E|nr:hypothetical protein [Ralstonia sp. LMG 32965]MBN6211372.1 hypothetical protein [Ralstonia pickettii]
MVFIVDYRFQIKRILPNVAQFAKIACGVARGGSAEMGPGLPLLGVVPSRLAAGLPIDHSDP